MFDFRVLMFIGAVFFLLFFGGFFINPIRKILKFFIRTIIGGAVILIANYVGTFLNFHIGFNLVTSVIVGVLGLPGMALIAIM